MLKPSGGEGPHLAAKMPGDIACEEGGEHAGQEQDGGEHLAEGWAAGREK